MLKLMRRGDHKGLPLRKTKLNVVWDKSVSEFIRIGINLMSTMKLVRLCLLHLVQ
jgi:hypothetical protein